MTTNQTERVSDEELDQMIWKLERDGGMTPKLLSLMRELREVRKAAREPVAWMYDGEDGREYNGHNEFSGGGKGVPLYAAPPAPIVPDELTREEYKRRFMADDCFDDTYRGGWNACRAAMLNAEKLNQPVSETNLAVAQIKPVADLYGITSPTGSETTFTFDAGEASRFADSGWSVQEYVELERYQEAMIGNSPVAPDGWVLVPVEPTEGMVISGFESEPDEFFSEEEDWAAYEAMSGCQQAAHRAKLCYAAMLAAASKEVKSE